MATNVSKTQIDRLGERLKKGDITEDDLRLLDTYRRSLADAYDEVVEAVRKELGLEPTGRPAKSTTSISEKLRRESIRLTQVQDIAGCRLIVSDIADQERVVQSLSHLFEETIIVDRRKNPSHGYRAVHVIVKSQGKLVEIQVRTSLQQLWAELSEKLSDIFDPAIKYGRGNKESRKILEFTSASVSLLEDVEVRLVEYLAQMSPENNLTAEEKQQIASFREKLISSRQKVIGELRDIIEQVKSLKG